MNKKKIFKEKRSSQREDIRLCRIYSKVRRISDSVGYKRVRRNVGKSPTRRENIGMRLDDHER